MQRAASSTTKNRVTISKPCRSLPNQRQQAEHQATSFIATSSATARTTLAKTPQERRIAHPFSAGRLAEWQRARAERHPRQRRSTLKRYDGGSGMAGFG